MEGAAAREGGEGRCVGELCPDGQQLEEDLEHVQNVAFAHKITTKAAATQHKRKRRKHVSKFARTQRMLETPAFEVTLVLLITVSIGRPDRDFLVLAHHVISKA